MAAPLLQKERVLELLREAEVEHEIYEHAEVATAEAQVRVLHQPFASSLSPSLPPSLSLTRRSSPSQSQSTRQPRQVQALAHVEGVRVTKNLFLRVS
jgi:hypothetical protein